MESLSLGRRGDREEEGWRRNHKSLRKQLQHPGDPLGSVHLSDGFLVGRILSKS